jgi:hypothetical protein
MRLAITSLAATLLCLQFFPIAGSSASAHAKEFEREHHQLEHGHNQRHGVESSIIIDAPQKAVFEGIQSSRLKEPDHRKLVSHHNQVAVIDESFPELPVIGQAHCTYKEIEIPYKKIEFQMIKSDKLKAFEGYWELTPVDNGEKTEVKLRTFTEPKIWVPFVRELSSSSTIKDIHRRLKNLKHWTEEDHRSSCRQQVNQ